MLDKYTADITIKWPNDIMWKDKKIAGILIENNIAGKHINYSIVGIGININQGCFSQDSLLRSFTLTNHRQEIRFDKAY